MRRHGERSRLGHPVRNGSYRDEPDQQADHDSNERQQPRFKEHEPNDAAAAGAEQSHDRDIVAPLFERVVQGDKQREQRRCNIVDRSRQEALGCLMNEFLDKFLDLERKLSEERGAFSLFALFLREDASDKWDLIAASPWIEADRKRALADITQRIQQTFAPEELSRLSRVVLVEQGNPAIEAVNQAIRVQHGKAEVKDSNFFGLQIKHAYIISSERLNTDAEVPA